MTESSASKRLHKLCDFLEKQKNESPYSAESWDELQAENDNLRAEIKKFRGLLLWTLYHHQGGSSTIGQSIRAALNIGEHDKISKKQIQDAKSVAWLWLR